VLELRASFSVTCWKAEPEGGEFTMDGQEVGIRFLLAEIMSIASIGPCLSLAPAAEPGDGLLDLVYLEPEAAPRCWSGSRRPRRTRRRSQCDGVERLPLNGDKGGCTWTMCFPQAAIRSSCVDGGRLLIARRGSISKNDHAAYQGETGGFC
jgi:hypothetical protein